MAVPLSALVPDPLGVAVMETSLPLPEKKKKILEKKILFFFSSCQSEG